MVSEVQPKVDALKESLKGKDIDAIKNAQNDLMSAAQKIGQALYAQQGAQGAQAGAQGAQAGAGQASSQANSQADDDVVDAQVVDDDNKKDQKDGE